MKDKNYFIAIEFKDVHNMHLDGDFNLIPREAIIAIISETAIVVDEMGNLNRTINSYRLIVGKPIYKCDEVVLANAVTMPGYANELPILIVGQMHNNNYLAFPRKKDIVVGTRDEFISTINRIGAEFLEKLDNADASLRLKI